MRTMQDLSNSAQNGSHNNRLSAEYTVNVLAEISRPGKAKMTDSGV